MKTLLRLGLLPGCLACGLAVAQPVNYAMDQAHDWPDVIEGIHSLIGYPTITQEFTPTFGALDVVEIYTRDWSNPITNGIGGKLQVWLREDSTNGPVIALSEPLDLPDGWVGPAPFLFTNLVWLTPGNRYAIEVRLLEGNNWGVDSYGAFAPPYEGGRYFVGTNLVKSADMWFRTGVRSTPTRLAIERDGLLRWAGIPPLAYDVWTSSDLTNWNYAGFVRSFSTNYVFRNSGGFSERVFYKVRSP